MKAIHTYNEKKVELCKNNSKFSKLQPLISFQYFKFSLRVRHYDLIFKKYFPILFHFIIYIQAFIQ